MVKHELAKVRLWGETVGALAEHDNGFCVFEYSPNWIAKSIEISPIHLPLSREKYLFYGLPKQTFKGLPAAFTNTFIYEYVAR